MAILTTETDAPETGPSGKADGAGAGVPASGGVVRASGSIWTPRAQLRWSIVAGVLLAFSMVSSWTGAGTAHEVLAWASLAIGLVYGVRAAGLALRARRVDIDVLMVVAALAAASVGHAEEGALLLVLFTFAGALEQLAMERTRREINALRDVIPDSALVMRDGVWTSVPPEQVAVGERVRVRPGDRVPVDVRVEEGRSDVDQSALTGESVPRPVAPGDEVMAGAINGGGPLVTTALRPAAESGAQRILAMVTEAREQRQPVQRLIDRVGQPYTYGVLALSAATMLALWLLPTPAGVEPRTAWDAAYAAITLLIVASPCAMVIATPTATLATIARGARAGVLFKGGEAIDRLARVGAVCFDKTGTLTLGHPVFERIEARPPDRADALLDLAAALEQDSTHPTAKAITEAGRGSVALEEVRAAPGRGMAGLFEGRAARVGSLDFVGEVLDGPARTWAEAALVKARNAGGLGVAVGLSPRASGDAPEAGVVVLTDTPRPGAEVLVAELHRLGVRPVRMLTGDDEIVARRISDQLGLDGYVAGLLPEQKVEQVRALREQTGRRVAVIGDGINDAPALAAADVSMAVGSIGSGAALESADIVLLSDDLARVPWAMALARAARRTVVFNLSFAGGVIVLMALVVLAGAALGVRVPMAAGVVAHEGGTVAVVLNSLRLLWFRRPTGGSDRGASG